MPVVFGTPFTESEQTRDQFGEAVYPRTSTSLAVSFETSPEQLQNILPEGKGLTLRGDPVVTVSANYNVGDLRMWAGRSYEIVMVSFPVTFEGRDRQTHGDYAPVIWENLTDPIIAGREAIGWSKVYADIEPLRVTRTRAAGTAGWYGFKFLDIGIDNLSRLSQEEVATRQKNMANSPSEGSIHWKYIRRTGTTDEADADYLTMSTNVGAPTPDVHGFEVWTGDGSIAFHQGSWRDLPMTIIQAVNTLADLEVKHIFGATLSKSDAVGSGGMGETIILE
ncbi:MAG: acetoacetate decarboxylase family protein [Pseudomonadales bacterium]|nr:acetoacetate decarboxylase family protein [Pseudomonadales bacterium]